MFISQIKVSSYHVIKVGLVLNSNVDHLLPSRKMAAKESVDLMSTILQQSAETAFTCASRVMKKNTIIIDAKEINDDIFECIDRQNVKKFHLDLRNTTCLKGIRSKGRIDTTVKYPITHNQIDTRIFGNSRARHRADNNCFSDSGVASR